MAETCIGQPALSCARICREFFRIAFSALNPIDKPPRGTRTALVEIMFPLNDGYVQSVFDYGLDESIDRSGATTNG